MNRYQQAVFRNTTKIVIMLSIVLFTSIIQASSVYDYFRDFCAIGERVPGTEGHRRARDFILANLEDAVVDSFSTRGVQFYNIYKHFSGKEPRIGLAAHWDSDINCPGANDGGSGVALLLSLADTLSKTSPEMSVDLLFFDGEDVDKAELFGSKHFASRCIDTYSFILVLDMVGDKDLQLFQEGNSAKFFPDFVDSIWRIGMKTAPEIFIPTVKYHIKDDHISLIQYGIRAIDIIDFDYPYWDTEEDTEDKCSKESLEIMYNFLLRIVYPRYLY